MAHGYPTTLLKDRESRATCEGASRKRRLRKWPAFRAAPISALKMATSVRAIDTLFPRDERAGTGTQTVPEGRTTLDELSGIYGDDR